MQPSEERRGMEEQDIARVRDMIALSQAEERVEIEKRLYQIDHNTKALRNSLSFISERFDEVEQSLDQKIGKLSDAVSPALKAYSVILAMGLLVPTVLGGIIALKSAGLQPLKWLQHFLGTPPS